MIFLKMILCHSIQPNISPPFTQLGYNYGFQLQGYHNLLSKRLHIKEILNYIQGHMTITHIRLKSFSILSQEFVFTYYMHDVRTQIYLNKTHT